jgi:hypothetical protein
VFALVLAGRETFRTIQLIGLERLFMGRSRASGGDTGSTLNRLASKALDALKMQCDAVIRIGRVDAEDAIARRALPSSRMDNSID